MKHITKPFLYTLILLFGVSNLMAQCNHQADYSSLRALYLSTDGDKWLNNTNWPDSAFFAANPTAPAGLDMSSWFGIGCNLSGRVNSLILTQNKMNGELPDEFYNLTEIEVINLFGNSHSNSSGIMGGVSSSISNFSKLKKLNLALNEISGIVPVEIGDLPNLEILYLNNNKLSGEVPSVIGQLVSLKRLNLAFNKLSGGVLASLVNLVNLERLALTGNDFTGELTSDLGNLLKLKRLDLSFNEFSGNIPVELSNLISLEFLSLGANKLIGTIPKELEKLQNLTYLGLFANNLSGEIPKELGNLKNIESLLLNNNNFEGSIPLELGDLINLLEINLFGNDLSGCFDINLLNLFFLDVDVKIDNDNHFDAAWADFCDSGEGLCPCSNCVSGELFFDFNNNGCDDSDSISTNIPLILINDTVLTIYTTFIDGHYKQPINLGLTKIVPEINTDYFSLEPDTAFVSWPEDSLNLNHDFCITPLGDFDDLKITVLPLNAARPGFTSRYKIVYENQGTKTSSGKVSFTFFNSDVLTFDEALPQEDSLSGNSVIWEYDDLKPFEKRELMVSMKLNTPTDTPPLVGGEELNFVAKVSPIADDETPDDNESYLNQTVVNSYDPNDKNCLEGSILTEEMIGSDVTYMIRFENTGTASAVNMKVTDTINTELFDIETLRLVEASHPCRFVVEGNDVVHFYFDDIYLPYEDATNDGYVVFKIQTLPTLVVGDSLTNFADIYFDFNPAIRTNTSTTYVREIIPLDISLSVTSAEVCSGEKVYVQGLARGGTGNYTYSWSSSQSDFSSDDNNIIDSPTEDVKYILVVDDGETTIQDTIDIRVFESPELSLDITNPSCFRACDGFMTYAVDGGTGPFIVDSSKLFNLCADDYYFTVRDVNGCRDRVEFEVEEPEEIVITSLAKDSTFTYTGGVGGVRPMFEVHGVFLVLTLEDDKGCIGKDSIALSAISNTLLEEHIQMFPNPVHQSLQIKSAYKFYEISITDALGKTVQLEKLDAETKDYSIPFSELNPGVYFVELKGAEFRYVKRVLKQ